MGGLVKFPKKIMVHLRFFCIFLLIFLILGLEVVAQTKLQILELDEVKFQAAIKKISINLVFSGEIFHLTF